LFHVEQFTGKRSQKSQRRLRAGVGRLFERHGLVERSLPPPLRTGHRWTQQAEPVGLSSTCLADSAGVEAAITCLDPKWAGGASIAARTSSGAEDEWNSLRFVGAV